MSCGSAAANSPGLTPQGAAGMRNRIFRRGGWRRNIGKFTAITARQAVRSADAQGEGGFEHELAGVDVLEGAAQAGLVHGFDRNHER